MTEWEIGGIVAIAALALDKAWGIVKTLLRREQDGQLTSIAGELKRHVELDSQVHSEIRQQLAAISVQIRAHNDFATRLRMLEIQQAAILATRKVEDNV